MALNDTSESLARMQVGSLEQLVEDLADQYKTPACIIWSMVGQIIKDERSFISADEAFQKEVEKHVLASCLSDNDYLFKD
ncbi:hypothetical protein LCGC14_0262910 [marine sediment metagenome]|uniref:Uncharacterized protein n=1 Tax=marine sediment metagenome TaxID=412755 RepID=A0A0F9UI25_9ZZZZ